MVDMCFKVPQLSTCIARYCFKSAMELPNENLILQEYEVQQELLFLSRSCARNRLCISAAGYFRVVPSFVFNAFVAVTSFSAVIIQFNRYATIQTNRSHNP